jgi:hypothetical protein
MKKRITLEFTFNHVPFDHMPKTGTAAYTLLSILSNGALHKRASLIRHPILGESMRSALQRLKSDAHGCWLIHSVPIEGTNTTGLQLDPRHLEGCAELDAQARRERRKTFKAKSKVDATRGRHREPKAIRELQQANNEYFKFFGDAANDATFKKINR